MRVSTAADLWVTWSEYDRAVLQLAQLVHESGWQFDLVICLARGGLRPGDVLSRIFAVPLAVLAVSSYRQQAGTVRGELSIASHLTLTNGELAGRALLVDDLADSGSTLNQVTQHLQQQVAALTEIKTAVIWRKAASTVEPDYCLYRLAANPWIHQPFEKYDLLRPAELHRWIEAGEENDRG